MRVKPGKTFAALIGLGLLAMAGQAAAGCDSGCKPPAPPSPPSHPGKPNMPGGGGCGGGHCGGGNNGNVNVNVNVNVKAGASANAYVGPGSFNGSGSGATYYGGGYGNWSQTPGTPSSMGLNVEGGEVRAMESYSTSRSLTKIMIIEAACIDDKGVPHPASQVFGAKDVNSAYAGEVYRCIAGTKMRYTLTDKDSRDGGKSFDCRKGEALWYDRNVVTCKVQINERQCNERSLLRKFGAGVKILTLVTTESYQAQREVVKQSSASYSSQMVFDGGVGGFVQ
ncbi:hypothetical protein [Asticcacaulis sp. YBE204]|uniref:hypothetical protein n=1 Tax=Asticcacaulis sp. YBE204 TaxID=1282363 RepID=UPI0003C3C88A|nr:hypothetical protein [Asticcacaulis sp. YBE204]ESQ78457.1 hypothetical protein AEYBE204_12955 [Asticcacaulis sp. YBE204]